MTSCVIISNKSSSSFTPTSSCARFQSLCLAKTRAFHSSIPICDRCDSGIAFDLRTEGKCDIIQHEMRAKERGRKEGRKTGGKRGVRAWPQPFFVPPFLATPCLL